VRVVWPQFARSPARLSGSRLAWRGCGFEITLCLKVIEAALRISEDVERALGGIIFIGARLVDLSQNVETATGRGPGR
jgi:hypothetical protein